MRPTILLHRGGRGGGGGACTPPARRSPWRPAGRSYGTATAGAAVAAARAHRRRRGHRGDLFGGTARRQQCCCWRWLRRRRRWWRRPRRPRQRPCVFAAAPLKCATPMANDTPTQVLTLRAYAGSNERAGSRLTSQKRDSPGN